MLPFFKQNWSENFLHLVTLISWYQLIVALVDCCSWPNWLQKSDQLEPQITWNHGRGMNLCHNCQTWSQCLYTVLEPPPDIKRKQFYWIIFSLVSSIINLSTCWWVSGSMHVHNDVTSHAVVTDVFWVILSLFLTPCGLIALSKEPQWFLEGNRNENDSKWYIL